MKNSVTNRQMFFIVLLTLTAVTIIGLPKAMAEAAGVGSWFTLMICAALYAVPACIIVALNRMFQGEVLFDYSKRLVGKTGAFLLGVFYLLYFILVSSYLCASMTDIIVSNFFVHTPRRAVVIFSLPFYGYTAYKGIRSVARVCEVFGMIFLFVILLCFVLMLFQGDVDHIRPLFVPEDTLSYLRAIKAASFSFLGIEVMTMIPLAQKDRKRAPRVIFFLVLCIGLFYILNVESTIMMTGINEVQSENNALISAIRKINVPLLSFFERMDMFFLTAGFAGLFCAKTIVITAVVEYASKLIPKAKRIFLVAAALVIIFTMDMVLFGMSNYGEVYQVFFLTAGNAAAVGIPIILYIIAKVKGHAYQTH